MGLRNVWLALVLSLGLVGLAHAGKPKTPLEASQLLSGNIQVDAQGAVTGFTVDQRAHLSDNVFAFLDGTLRQWRFAPVLVDGLPVAAQSTWSMRLVLRPIEGDRKHYEMVIKGVSFNVGTRPDGHYPHSIQLQPPAYPAQAARRNGSAEVYMVVKVGRDGAVQEAVAEQVNLLSYGGEKDAEWLRREFEAVCVAQAMKKWKFQPPTVGDAVDDDYWSVRVPVIFSLGQERTIKGGWTAYAPGPRRQVPWATPEDPMGFSPDALPGGGAHLAGVGGLRLLTMGGSR